MSNFLDDKFYTDVESGKKISLRDASQVSVNSHWSDNSLSVYDKSTNTHHKISEPFDTQDDALEHLEDFNKQIHGEVIEQTHSTASHREHERWQERKTEIEAEAKSYG